MNRKRDLGFRGLAFVLKFKLQIMDVINGLLLFWDCTWVNILLFVFWKTDNSLPYVEKSEDRVRGLFACTSYCGAFRQRVCRGTWYIGGVVIQGNALWLQADGCAQLFEFNRALSPSLRFTFYRLRAWLASPCVLSNHPLHRIRLLISVLMLGRFASYRVMPNGVAIFDGNISFSLLEAQSPLL